MSLVLSIVSNISKKMPDQVGLKRSRSYITSSSVSKSHSCAHGWREVRTWLSKTQNELLIHELHIPRLPFLLVGEVITNLLSVYDVLIILSLFYNIF